ncbi:PspA/IM30 family protein [Synechocystis sp. LKSZ1]|uniref:PspA/IM30 family protein n=1 Tax=Synechocystis sp. LKSZ1 TaxID=3144951 RepID=UPI00336C1B78
MGLFDLMGRLLRSQLNQFHQKLEDPEVLLEEMTAQMELELIELRRALAEAIAVSKSTERQRLAQQGIAQRWYERAQLALDKDNEGLAREALQHWQNYQMQETSLATALTEQQQVIGKIRADLLALEQKYFAIKTQKSLYLARLKAAIAAQKLVEITSQNRSDGVSHLFEQIELKILEMEAQGELVTNQPDPLESQFRYLEQQSVDNALAQLKARKYQQPRDHFSG